MEVVKVLGSERCYLMSDGSKIPFERKHEIFGKKGVILQSQKPVIEKPTPEAVSLFGKKKRRKSSNKE